MVRKQNALKRSSRCIVPGVVFVVSLTLHLLTSTAASAAEKASLLGDWTLNRELTEKRRPKLPKAKSSRSGFGAVHVGVGGVLVPNPGSGGPSPSASSATANMPKILGCEQMNVVKSGQVIEITCPKLAQALKFTIGNLHGRKTRYSSRKLSEKYSSTSRRVTHTLNLERSNRMEIKVTVKPKGAKMLTYLLVFDRVAQT